jgi:ubiquitin carboxyl-terminal hydrolase 5/13
MEDAAPPPKRLAIVEEREEDKYTHSTELKCWQCDPNAGRVVPGGLSHGKVGHVLDDT